MDDRLSVFYDACVFEHDTGEGFFESEPSPYLPIIEKHPENAERIRNMVAVLEQGPINSALDWHQHGLATEEEMCLFHDKPYIRSLAAIEKTDTVAFSNTTIFGPGSFDVICRAAGQAIGASEHVWSGLSKRAYALVRPPGHHAQIAMADGYCFVNNIGVAIETLRKKGLKRAAVIDWDVHHGNGTQEGFYEDPDILTISVHMNHGAWGNSHPQTGYADEVGVGAGLGYNINIPLSYGSGDKTYTRVFDDIIAPAVRDHGPEIVFVAAGQDANQFDPNGRQLVTMDGFYQLGARVRRLADDVCDGRLVLVQEGGYQLSYAAYCLHATLDGVLLRQPGLPDPIAYMMEDTSDLDRTVSSVCETREDAMARMA